MTAARISDTQENDDKNGWTELQHRLTLGPTVYHPHLCLKERAWAVAIASGVAVGNFGVKCRAHKTVLDTTSDLMVVLRNHRFWKSEAVRATVHTGRRLDARQLEDSRIDGVYGAGEPSLDRKSTPSCQT